MILPAYTYAWQHYSFTEYKYTTSPESEDIDQGKYHELCCVVNVIAVELVNCRMSRAQRQHYVFSYLSQIDTPESKRLISDLEELAI